MGPRFGVILRYSGTRSTTHLIYRQTGGSSARLEGRQRRRDDPEGGFPDPNPAKPWRSTSWGGHRGRPFRLDFDGVNKINITDATFDSGGSDC
jgi:hypothetical protein